MCIIRLLEPNSRIAKWLTWIFRIQAVIQLGFIIGFVFSVYRGLHSKPLSLGAYGEWFYFAGHELVNDLQVTSSVCSVTQNGSDGFGHQLEGKLSVMLLAELFPERFEYIHVPFKGFQHITLTGEYVEQYMGFKDLFLEPHPDWDYEYPSTLKPYIVNYSEPCDPYVIYSVDNAWVATLYNLTLKPRINNILMNSTLFQGLRHAYFNDFVKRSNPVNTKFRSGTKNVVVHIRRGDGMWRAMTTEYYDAAIDYYETLYGNSTYFLIESDDIEWDYIQKTLPERLGPENVHIGNENSVLLTFHRMMLADGLVASDSSLDRAAIMYRSNQNPVVVPDNPYFQMLDSYVHVTCKTNCSVRTIWYPE